MKILDTINTILVLWSRIIPTHRCNQFLAVGWLTVVMGLFFSSCSSDTDTADGGRMISMPIVLAIPANNADLTTGTTGAKATRAEGDPGTYEKFQLPTHLYIYLINTSIDEKETKVIPPEGMDKDNGYTLKTDKWTKTTTQDNNKDSIYTYNDQIRIIIPENRKTGVVYAAMSTVPITVTYIGTNVADATFTLGDAVSNKSEALKNLYSSPYNLNNSNGYYGTVSDYRSNSPYINMVLYHVASKLDVQWNVDAKVQSSVKLSQITLTGLSGGGKLFKPLENTASSLSTSTKYSEAFTLDAGSQWYGRHATYVIPMKQTDGTYQFPMTLTNSVSNTDKTTTATAKPSATATVFVPWIYGTVKVTQW